MKRSSTRDRGFKPFEMLRVKNRKNNTRSIVRQITIHAHDDVCSLLHTSMLMKIANFYGAVARIQQMYNKVLLKPYS